MMNIDWWRLWPRYWSQSYPTNQQWDKILIDLMDKYQVKIVDDYTVKIGPMEVWTANFPYAFGKPWSPKVDVLPKVATRRRLKYAIDAIADPKPDPMVEVVATIKASHDK